jgi:hypothetical protein
VISLAGAGPLAGVRPEVIRSVLNHRFGESFQSRTPGAQVNEVRCKLIAYNLTVVVHEIFEDGTAPTFVGCP